MTGDPAMNAPVTAARQLLCVLGMHRSGTSVVTQLLHRLGARLGPHLLDAMGDVNDDGFWEDSRVVDLDERLLAALGSRWQDYEAPDFAASADPHAVAALRAEAVAHFSANYEAPGIWVVKDPRLCRLLPFWREAWPEAGLETCFVTVLRHPFAVAKSLHRRDRIPVEYGVVLWLEYTLEALSHSEGQPGIVVTFDAVARDPLELPRLLESRGIRWSLDEAGRSKIVATVVKPGLRHHDDSMPKRTGLPDVMAFAEKTYAALAAASALPGQDLPGREWLAVVCNEWHALRQRHAGDLAMLQRTTDEVMALSAECVRIGTLHSEALSVVKEKDNILDETTRFYQGLLQDRNQLIKDIAYFRFWRLVPRVIRRIKRR